MKLASNLSRHLSNRTTIVLVLIVVVGSLLRGLNIESNPVSLYGDELTIAYDSYSVLKTGYDQTGQFLPLTFRMGSGRPPGYVYGSIPFIALFGPTALGVRTLSLLSGIGTIVLTFLIGRKLFSAKIGLVAAGLVAVSPWAISISRGGFEATFALFLTLLGAVFYLYAAKTPWFYIASAICWGVTLHTYPTYKLVLPIFILVLIWFLGGLPKAKIERRWFLGGVVVLALFCLLVIQQTLSGGSEERFLSLNVFSEMETKKALTQKIISDRTRSHLPDFLIGYIHNRPVEYIQIIFNSYMQNFSPEYLLMGGDKNPRHNMVSLGAFYIIDLFLIIFGWVSLIKRKLTKILIFLVAWILISPLATTFLLQTHFLRSAFIIVPCLLISALGLVYLWDILEQVKGKWIVKSFLFLLFFVQFVFLLNNLFFLSPYKFSSFWAEPAKLAVLRAEEQKQLFDYVIISTRIDNVEFAYPVYSQIDPRIVQQANKQQVSLNNYSFKKFDNVYIGSVPDTLIETFLRDLNGRVLYIGSRYEQPYLQNYILVNGKDGQIAFIEKNNQ